MSIGKIWKNICWISKSPVGILIAALLTILIFILCWVNIPLPGLFNISKNHSENLLKLITTSYGSIFGISIALIAILFAVLQNKKYDEDILPVSFRESYIFPTLGFAISSIIILLFLSFTKETRTLITDEIFIKAVILGGYYFAVFIILIGFIFYRVYKFLETDFLFDKYVENIIGIVTQKPKGSTLFKIKNVNNRLEAKLLKYSAEGDNENLEKMKNIYIRIFDSDPKSIIVENFSDILLKAYSNAIESNRKNSIKVLIEFWRQIIIIGLNNKSVFILNLITQLPSNFYNMSFSVKYQSSISKKLILILREVLSIPIPALLRDSGSYEELKNINGMAYALLLAYCLLLRDMIDNKDGGGFKEGIEGLNAIEGSFKIDTKLDELNYERNTLIFHNESNVDKSKIMELDYHIKIRGQVNIYLYYIKFSLFSWTNYLYSIGKISLEHIRNISNSIKLDLAYPYDEINMFLSILKNSDNLFNWFIWSFKYKEKNFHSIASETRPEYWLSLGLLVRYLKTNFDLDIDSVTEEYNFRVLSDIITGRSNYLEVNFEKWKQVIQIQSKEDLEVRLKVVEKFFLDQKVKQELQISKDIIIQPFSQKCVDDFKKKVFDQWKETQFSSAIFKYFNNIDYIAEDENLMKINAYNPFMRGVKEIFIEKHHVDSDDLGIGSEINKHVDHKFYSAIHKQIEGKPCDRYDSLSIAIDNLVKKIEEKKYNPNLIIINPRLIYKDRSFPKNEFFTPQHKISEDVKKELDFPILGRYKKLLIISSFYYFEKNVVFVCDLKKTIRMVRQKNPDWYDQILKMNISEVDEKTAKDILNEKPENWLKRDGLTISEEEALLEIQKGANVDIFENLYFKLISTDAIEIAEINV